MKIKILGNNHSIFDQYLAEIRDVNVQKDPLRFRENMYRIGELFAYEISKELNYVVREVTTPLGVAKVPVLEQQPVLATILRAGLAMHNGLLKILDRAENCFISAYRKYTEGGEFEIEFEYMASPLLYGKVVILSDPMLASGRSMEIGYEALFSKGIAFSCSPGIDHCQQAGRGIHPKFGKGRKCNLWLGAVDEEMTPKSYISPRIGRCRRFGLR
jgi:uracil phosphoribosyltransferase